MLKVFLPGLSFVMRFEVSIDIVHNLFEYGREGPVYLYLCYTQIIILLNIKLFTLTENLGVSNKITKYVPPPPLPPSHL